MSETVSRAREWLDREKGLPFQLQRKTEASIISDLLAEVERLENDLNIAKHTLGEYHIEASKELCMNSAVIALKAQNEQLQSELSRYANAVEVEGQYVEYDHTEMCVTVPKMDLKLGQRVRVLVLPAETGGSDGLEY